MKILSCMNYLMWSELLFVWKCFPTSYTFIGILPCITSLVYSKMGLGESFLTFCTLTWLFICRIFVIYCDMWLPQYSFLIRNTLSHVSCMKSVWTCFAFIGFSAEVDILLHLCFCLEIKQFVIFLIHKWICQSTCFLIILVKCEIFI